MLTKVENCSTCRNYFPTPKGNEGDCHYLPPSAEGFPTVYPTTWCSQYRADQLKIDAQKSQENK